MAAFYLSQESRLVPWLFERCPGSAPGWVGVPPAGYVQARGAHPISLSSLAIIPSAWDPYPPPNRFRWLSTWYRLYRVFLAL